VGARHSCARVAGAVWCWGANDAGQLGDGTLAMRTEPVRAAGVEGATRVVAD
jgi:alpha-tubulin suppressor-like RCC1 family protein